MESLKLTAKALDSAGVTWAVGASVLLYCKGIAATPRDIDLIVATEDAEAANRALRSIGRRMPDNPHTDYATRHFMEYEVAGVEVDVMAGFIIRSGERSYEYILRPGELEHMEAEGVLLPFCPLEDWLVLYGLMQGREAKVALIEDYLRTHAYRRDILRRWHKTTLPEPLARRIGALL